MRGWVKLHRNIITSGLFNTSNGFRVYIYLLLMARFKAGEVKIRDKSVYLDAGTAIVSIPEMAEVLNWTEGDAIEGIRELQTRGMIQVDGVLEEYTYIITIPTWSSSQGSCRRIYPA